MKHFLKALCGLALVISASFGCASSSDYDSEGMMVIRDEGSQASKDAYSNMLFNKAMPRRTPSNNEFWFQHCEPTGQKTYYSKTVYECEFH